ncbi:MAG: hypothetical protein LBQ50_11965 [Planctomycetaceae bacterium]|jgi:hypothetical protein|nr:hypothetical protein [Planctomycetaceae bacterium]
MILRWVTSVAVLFYVLMPQMGVCHCSCCQHSEGKPKTEAVLTDTSLAPETKKSCCCSEKEPSELPENDSRSQQKKKESKSCPCITAADVSLPMLESTISTYQISDEFKKWLQPLSALPLQPVADIQAVSLLHLKTLEMQTSQLPLRLHLLFNVMLN